MLRRAMEISENEPSLATARPSLCLSADKLLHSESAIKSDIEESLRYISEHKRRVRVFNEKLNMYAQISRLPPEILQEIFCLTTDEYVGAMDNFILGHICRHWRAIALGCGRLWSHIVANSYSTDVGVIRTLLTRSRGELLDIQLVQVVELSPNASPIDGEDVILLRPSSVIQLLLCELPRIRSLHLSLSPRAYVDFADYLTVPAPNLNVLVLSVTESAIWPHRRRDTRSTLSGLQFNSPGLRSLSIRGFPTFFGLSLVHGTQNTLSQLILRVPYDSSERLLEAHTLLSALQSMTVLTLLDLGSRVVSLDLSRERFITDTVDCRSLKTLRLCGEVLQLNWLLCRLQLTESVNVDLAIFDESPVSENEYNDLGSMLSQVLYSHNLINDSVAPSRMGYAACLWIRSLDLYGNNPCILHFILADTLDTITDHMGATDIRDVARDCSLETWEQVEAVMDCSRTHVPYRVGHRALHIWMLDSLPRRSQIERVESIWNPLHLDHVHSLFLDGVPMDMPDAAEVRPVDARLLSAFMGYVLPMVSVKRLVVRDWDPSWLNELLNSSQETYPEVPLAALLPLPALQSLFLLRSSPSKVVSWEVASVHQAGNLASNSDRRLDWRSARLLRYILLSRQETLKITGPGHSALLHRLSFSGYLGNGDVVSHLRDVCKHCVWAGDKKW